MPAYEHPSYAHEATFEMTCGAASPSSKLVRLMRSAFPLLSIIFGIGFVIQTFISVLILMCWIQPLLLVTNHLSILDYPWLTISDCKQLPELLKVAGGPLESFFPFSQVLKG
jgi:hypothetical protein